jgi:hypothetical protein
MPLASQNTRRTPMLGLMLLIFVCLVSCNNKARESANEVHLPPNALRVLIARELKQPTPVFVKFDGLYPKNWPAEIKFPDDFHTTGDPMLNEKQAQDLGTIVKFKGISHQLPADLYAFFKDQLLKGKWSITIEKELSSRNATEVVKYGGKRLQAELKSGAGTKYFLFMVYNDPNADGWTYFQGGYSYP